MLEYLLILKSVLPAPLSRRVREHIFQDWVLDLTQTEQSTLASTLRGTDKDNGTCQKSKEITRMLRFLISNPVKAKGYMSDKVLKVYTVNSFLKDELRTNRHWVEHIIYAGFIISKRHPNPYVRSFWGTVAGKANGELKILRKEEKYIKRVYEKYMDIYTKRGI